MQQGSARFALGEEPQTCGPKTRAEPQEGQELDRNLERGKPFGFPEPSKNKPLMNYCKKGDTQRLKLVIYKADCKNRLPF